jgi:hypothetical protein
MFLSAGEVALLLRKSTKWVYQKADELPGAFKLGGTWFFDREIMVTSLQALSQSRPGQILNRTVLKAGTVWFNP